MFCLKCGKEISETAKFCPHCGEGINGSSSAKPVKQKKPVNKKKVAINSSVAAVLAVVIGLGIYCILNPSPESVVKDFMKALEDGDYKAMGELFNEDYVRYQIETDGDDIDDWLERRFDDLENADIDFDIIGSFDMEIACEEIEEGIFTYYTNGNWETGDEHIASGTVNDCCVVGIEGTIDSDEEDYDYIAFFTLAKTSGDNKWGIIDCEIDDF